MPALQDVVQQLTRFTELKKTTAVISSLMWKPFDVRFKDHLQLMMAHRKALFEEIILQNMKESAKERAKGSVTSQQNVVQQSINRVEREEAAEEHKLAAEERRIMAIERDAAAESRLGIQVILEQTREQLRQLEIARIGE